MKKVEIEEMDGRAVEYAARKYPASERDICARAYRFGWKLFFDGVDPVSAWDRAHRFADDLKLEDYDHHATRHDVLAGYNAAAEQRR